MFFRIPLEYRVLRYLINHPKKMVDTSFVNVNKFTAKRPRNDLLRLCGIRSDARAKEILDICNGQTILFSLYDYSDTPVSCGELLKLVKVDQYALLPDD